MKLPEPAEYVWEPDGTFDIGQRRQLSTNTGPCGGWNVYPIYTAAQMIELRNAALEEAAKVCEQKNRPRLVQYPTSRSISTNAAIDVNYEIVKGITAAIRSLKEVQVINDPAEIRRVFELDDAEPPPPDSGFVKL